MTYTLKNLCLCALNGAALYNLSTLHYQNYDRAKKHISPRIHPNDYPGLNEKLAPFFKRIGIRQEVRISASHSIASSAGSSALTKGALQILLQPELYELDKEACLTVLKHESSHLKNSDGVSTSLISFISSLGSALLSRPFYPRFRALSPSLIKIGLSLSPAVPAFVAGIVARDGFLRYTEIRADRFAIQESTNEELLGGEG